MNIFERSNKWRWYLGGAGLLIVLISIAYTNYLASRLAETEQAYGKIYAEAQKYVQTYGEEDFDPFNLPTMVLSNNTSIPLILVSDNGGIYDAENFNREFVGAYMLPPELTAAEREEAIEEARPDSLYFIKKLYAWQEEGIEPLPSYQTKIYMNESNTLTQLRYFPYVQISLIAAFMFIGYLGINAARRSEQNRVWVGMAKETAHQLGTPISAIVGWLEHLKLTHSEDEVVSEIVGEMGKDVYRLELVANRFSKIGATPELEVVNVYNKLEEMRAYMEKRAPRRVSFDFPPADAGTDLVAINPLLFDWVIENLLRNALDAMEGKGTISAEVYNDAQFVYIDVSDTGKGIPAGKFNTVFQPGYTTKQRGWGLGLSLTRRIIKDYHNGRIFVKRSEEGVGTTFCIALPVVS